MKCSLLFFAVTHTSRDHDVLGKFHLLHYQVPFVNVLLLANGPNMIILMVNRRVEVKVFFISKKTFFANFTGRRWISFFTAFMTFLLDGFRDDLSWNTSKGRQLKVTFHNSLNG